MLESQLRRSTFSSVTSPTILTAKLGPGEGCLRTKETGLQQLMAGSRKWKLNAPSRSDLFSLMERAAKVSGIPLAEEYDADSLKGFWIELLFRLGSLI